MIPVADERVHFLEITAIDRVGDASRDIAAFALDTPRLGDQLRGDGIEMNGWVIGRGQRVSGVRVVAREGQERSAPLDVPRPDVAADYPAFPAAKESGFSFWAPIQPMTSTWRFSLDAVLDGGDQVRLADITGKSSEQLVDVPRGHRLVTAPDFVIVGTQRGGTTSLHAFLSTHPSVTTAATKELHYLTDRFERGRDWYAGQFPTTLPVGHLTGEATPYALFHPQAPRRLQQVAPEARIIMLLRNPIERAHSHYHHERGSGHECLSFAEALAAEPERLAGEEERLASEPGYVSFNHKHASYMARGEYARQVERWLAHFPHEHVLILRSEDLFDRPQPSLRRVTSFLGIPDARIALPAYNQTSGQAIDPVLRGRLRDRFEEPNRALSDLLGWRSEWQ